VVPLGCQGVFAGHREAAVSAEQSIADIKVELKPEGAYELFGGNVRGTIKEVDAPKRLVQTWQTRNGTWPADHFGTLTTKLDQGSDSTTCMWWLYLSWDRITPALQAGKRAAHTQS
jgi:activator of HSP90 ATPase